MREPQSVAGQGPALPGGDVARFSVVAPVELRERVEAIALRERRSLSAQCVVLLEQGLKATEQAA